jgi:hypothetical protein
MELLGGVALSFGSAFSVYTPHSRKIKESDRK